MTPTVDIVIPVHGHWELTERCLDSLAARDPCVGRIIVVDDASPDDTAARLRARSDIVAVILDANAGFSAACNAGTRATSADAIFFLNNDTFVEPGTIQRLAQTLGERGVAAVGPKLINADGTLQAAGLAMLPGRTNFERLFAYLDRDLAAGTIAYAPLALSGAALLVRRDAFFAVGAFDEGYRNGLEDVDVCVQLWAHGYRLEYEPRAAIVHLEGASRGKLLDDRHNQERFAERWATRLARVPRYAEPPAAVLDIRWDSANPLEESVRRMFRAALRAHAGARVVENAGAAARTLAFFERRKTLRVEQTASGAAAPVLWCAPSDERDAAAIAARAAGQCWVPSQRAAALLRDAGMAAERVHVTRPGFAPSRGTSARPLDRAIVVRSQRTPADRGAAIAGALGALPCEIIVAEDAAPGTVERVRGAAFVVFADGGDPWGLLGTAALSGGALVVAPAASPFVEAMPAETYVGVDDAGGAADAVRAVLAGPEAFIECGPRAARYAARCVPDVYAGRRVRELARATAYGIADVRHLAITPEIAATFAAREPVLT